MSLGVFTGLFSEDRTNEVAGRVAVRKDPKIALTTLTGAPRVTSASVSQSVT